MNRLLGILLVLQLGIVAAVYWPGSETTTTAGAMVDDLGGVEVSAIAVTDGDGESVRLVRETATGTWLLGSGLPADSGKVATLISAMTTLDPGFAIASSDSAADRFSVAEDNYERRIVVTAGETERVVYLGSAPSFRNVHARRDGGSAVYILELNSYDAPAAANSWLDRGLLATRDVRGLSLHGMEFTLGDEGWSRSDGEAVDTEAMETLVQALAGLQVSGVVAADDTDAAAAEEALSIAIMEDEQESRLSVLDNPEIERFYLQSDRFEPLFDTSAYDAERIIDAARKLAGLNPQESDSETESEITLEGETRTETIEIDTPDA